MIRILICDDHAIIRQGVKQIVADTPDIIVAGEAGNGQGVLSEIQENDYDVVLLDISMPGRNGLDVLQEIHNRRPQLPVLILTMHPPEQYGLQVLRAGASGYLTKESAPEELVTAIRKVSQGGNYVSSSFAEELAADLKAGIDRPLYQALSDREYEVMCMIASGKTVTKIAEGLFLSVKTVSTYRTRVLEKMKMSNNVELTHYAIKNGLVD